MYGKSHHLCAVEFQCGSFPKSGDPNVNTKKILKIGARKKVPPNLGNPQLARDYRKNKAPGSMDFGRFSQEKTTGYSRGDINTGSKRTRGSAQVLPSCVLCLSKEHPAKLLNVHLN